MKSLSNLKLVERSESDLNHQIRLLLSWHKARKKLTFKRINVSGVRRNIRGRDVFTKNEMAGMFDWMVFLPNAITIHMESKTRTGKLSDKQKAWLEELQEFGHPAVVVRDISEVVDILQKFGIYEP